MGEWKKGRKNFPSVFKSYLIFFNVILIVEGKDSHESDARTSFPSWFLFSIESTTLIGLKNRVLNINRNFIFNIFTKWELNSGLCGENHSR
jgi:hypothetical protein